MTRSLPVALLSLAVAGPAGAGPAPVETIRYDTSACFGFCPSYVVTISSDGRGVFEGRGHTAVRGIRRFAVTAAQFAAFRARLLPARPGGELLVAMGSPSCGAAATDNITVDVRWTGAGVPRHLSYYFGCSGQAALRLPLRDAPKALPIAGMIGQR